MNMWTHTEKSLQLRLKEHKNAIYKIFPQMAKQP